MAGRAPLGMTLLIHVFSFRESAVRHAPDIHAFHLFQREAGVAAGHKQYKNNRFLDAPKPSRPGNREVQRNVESIIVSCSE